MTIAIVPLQFDDGRLIEVVREAVARSFGVTALVVKAQISVEAGRDKLRNQVNSTWLLSLLRALPAENATKVLGVIDHDLFVPVLTYLFGEAELGGRAAVVSAHRFREENYGLPPSRTLLESRLISEAVHELGHTFGLTHCSNIGCVMQSTIIVEELDQKDRSFCLQCETRLAERMAEINSK